jgi:hypothetical protein
MSDYSPVRANGSVPYTSQASAAITGGQLVSASGDGTVAPSTTGDHSTGVAAHDAASGGRVTVWPIPGVVHESSIQGVIAVVAGNDIVAGTGGLVNKGTLATDAGAGTLLGIATLGGVGGTSKCRWIGT